MNLEAEGTKEQALAAIAIYSSRSVSLKLVKLEKVSHKEEVWSSVVVNRRVLNPEAPE